MRIVVVGCGVIGLTSAFLLRRRGHEVVVVDRRSGPAEEASHSNGALLTPSMAEPWNAPGCWRELVTSLVRDDSPLKMRLARLPRMARWALAFLRNAQPSQYERASLHNLHLALYSLRVLADLRAQTRLDYGHQARGSLRIFRDSTRFEAACLLAERRAHEGLRSQRLTAREAIDCEPALAPIASQLVGALHYHSDETGDARRFCLALAECARRDGVNLRFHTEIRALQARSGRITALVTDAERLAAERYVLAAGSYTTELLRQIGLALPVEPAKGYSLTFDYEPSGPALAVPVIDDALHAVVVPLGTAIRVAGTAEFAGFDLSLPSARLDGLFKLLRHVLPDQRFERTQGRSWCGLRPMSADGVPIISATPFENLLINTGHGHLGWTMAAGSAQLLVDLLDERKPALDPTVFSFARFARSASERSAA